MSSSRTTSRTRLWAAGMRERSCGQSRRVGVVAVREGAGVRGLCFPWQHSTPVPHEIQLVPPLAPPPTSFAAGPLRASAARQPQGGRDHSTHHGELGRQRPVKGAHQSQEPAAPGSDTERPQSRDKQQQALATHRAAAYLSEPTVPPASMATPDFFPGMRSSNSNAGICSTFPKWPA